MSAAPAPPIDSVALQFLGPLWSRGLYEPDWLLPRRAINAPRLAFVAFSDENAAESGSGSSPDISRLTRSLPLYLAESFLMHCEAQTSCLLLVARDRGPLVQAGPADTSSFLHLIPRSLGLRIVVAGSLGTAGAKLTLWDLDRQRALAALDVSQSPSDPGLLAGRLESDLHGALHKLGVLRAANPPDYYARPSDELRGPYCANLEHLLHQLMVANGVMPASSLDELAIFQDYFALANAFPKAASNARLIALCGLAAGALYGSPLLETYRSAALGWLEAAPPGSAIERLAPAIYSRLGEQNRLRAWLGRAPGQTDPAYAAWLARIQAG